MSHPLVAELERLLTEVVYPAEADGRTSTVLAEVAAEGRKRGLWNLFSSLHQAAAEFTGTDLAEMAELTGRSPLLAQVGVHSLNPDAGVVELLAALGTPEQRQRWLGPLASGATGSAYCMTEPGIASSDPGGLETRAEPDGTGWRVSGHKSWATGALDPRLAVLAVLAVTDPGAPPGDRFSLVLVPAGTPGVLIGANNDVFGSADVHRGGHPDVVFDGAAGEVLGEPGRGLHAAQSLLGPARVLHCMRLVGTAERALELMCRRLTGRAVRGRPLADNDLWTDRVAECRMRIEAVRSLVRTGTAGGIAIPPVTASLLKATVPEHVTWIVDTAIQAHGGDGLATRYLLADLYTHARSMRISDGPDEVHRRVVGRAELRRYRSTP